MDDFCRSIVKVLKYVPNVKPIFLLHISISYPSRQYLAVKRKTGEFFVTKLTDQHKYVVHVGMPFILRAFILHAFYIALHFNIISNVSFLLLQVRIHFFIFWQPAETGRVWYFLYEWFNGNQESTTGWVVNSWHYTWHRQQVNRSFLVLNKLYFESIVGSWMKFCNSSQNLTKTHTKH